MSLNDSKAERCPNRLSVTSTQALVLRPKIVLTLAEGETNVELG